MIAFLILTSQFKNFDLNNGVAYSTSGSLHPFSFISSDDSEDDIDLGTQCHLMDKVGLAEVALTELTHELQLSVSVSRSIESFSCASNDA